MGIKRFAAGVALSFLVLSAAQSQEIKADSIGSGTGHRNERSDSLRILSDELKQLKSQLDAGEKERQVETVWKRKKYWKLGFGIPSIERTDGEAMTWKTEFAVSLQRGKTAYFHSKPLWGMVKFGIDYGFMDLSYAKLKLKTAGTATASSSTPATSPGPNPDDGFDEIVSDDPSGSLLSLAGVDLGMHKFEYGLHVGPSISVNPWKGLIVAAYFHALPTASGILENDSFSYGFGCALSAGASVSYKAISVGVEGVWSSIKYKQASFEDDEDDESSSGEGSADLFGTKDFRLKQKGPRFYIALRF